jgi:trk system potassium uptake protein TrkA
MQIVIVGFGNVGRTLTEQLSREGHNIVVIDVKPEQIQMASNSFDVLGIVGNGASYNVLMDAGVDKADLLIAVAGSDELNLLSCVIAKKAGNCHTIARVRKQMFQQEAEFLRKELGISMIVNSEFESANEAARLIKYPQAVTVNSFAKERIELMKLRIRKESKLNGITLHEIHDKIGADILICMVERGSDVIIPDGNFTLQEKDLISVVTSSKEAIPFLNKLDFGSKRIHRVMIIGGGETSVYLTKQLTAMGIMVKIIEKDHMRCEELAQLLPQAIIVCGDGTDLTLLTEEDVTDMDAVIAWTNIDEENIMLSSYVHSISRAKLITEIHRVNYDEILKNMEIGTPLYPKKISSEFIVRYVRAMQNGIGSNVETLYRLIEDKVEALEFIVGDDADRIVGKQLSELKLKDNVLICCIQHKGTMITPKGHDIISAGDSLVVITTTLGLRNLNDILK